MCCFLLFFVVVGLFLIVFTRVACHICSYFLSIAYVFFLYCSLNFGWFLRGDWLDISTKVGWLLASPPIGRLCSSLPTLKSLTGIDRGRDCCVLGETLCMLLACYHNTLSYFCFKYSHLFIFFSLFRQVQSNKLFSKPNLLYRSVQLWCKYPFTGCYHFGISYIHIVCNLMFDTLG